MAPVKDDMQIHEKHSILSEAPDIIKLLEENIGRILFDINPNKKFFDPPLKSYFASLISFTSVL